MRSKKPILIAGPCSAESRTQVLNTAQALVEQTNITQFRAGVWKPRTRPGNFEGIGASALPWLKEVSMKHGIDVCTEVGTPNHVEMCLKNGINSFWIGTRTTTSPFAVSELAEAFKGNDISVMIKNPINPDINLWIGAVERMQIVGIKNVSLIHRGFSTLEKNKYRYNPVWELAQEIKKELPILSLISDPSHIAGHSQFVKEVVLLAKEQGIFDGFMIESHLHPKTAKTDAQQQITIKPL